LSNTPRILIFDSGVGGLSIAESIQTQHPYCDIIYASDNAFFPYGTKDSEVLIERVDNVLHQLQSTTKADIIVVACNTASTVALPTIRERFTLPIVGVVPAIKPAAKISQSKVIGLLATPGTVARGYTQNLIKEFASDCSVISIGSSELVALAEEKLRCGSSFESSFSPQAMPSFQERLAAIVSPFNDSQKMDTIVLACTHFPLLRNELKQALGHIKHWVDSGEAIARRVGYWLDELKLSSCSSNPSDTNSLKHYSLFTEISNEQQDSISQLAPALFQRGLGDIRFIEIT
jgi:glutamate racemase